MGVCIMFNKTFNYEGDTHNSFNSEVHEHRAPTDASVRLLREMEDKATKNLLSRSIINNNILNCKWSVFYSAENFSKIAMCEFILNGKVIAFKHDVTDIASGRDQNEACFDAIVKRLATEIALKSATALMGKSRDYSDLKLPAGMDFEEYIEKKKKAMKEMTYNYKQYYNEI